MPDVWSVAAVLAKWALYAGLLGSIGAIICALLFRIRTRAMALACLGLGAAVLSFALKGAALSGDATGLVDPELLALLWSTDSGTTFAMQVSGLGLLILGLPFGRLGLLVSLVGGAIALGSFIVSGHVASEESPSLSFTLLLHLLLAAFWIGILMPLHRMAKRPEGLADLARLAHQFGRIAIFAVPLLLVAGVGVASAFAGSVVAVFTTTYGLTLLAKGALVALMLALGAWNKLRLVPALHAGDGTAAQQLGRVVMWEWVVAHGILGLSAILTTAATPHI